MLPFSSMSAGPSKHSYILVLLLSLLMVFYLWRPNNVTEPPNSRRSMTTRRNEFFGKYDDDFNLTRRGVYSCSAKKPCENGACCGKSGYCGYGPVYCGDGCLSDCEAKAECGKYAEHGARECPLNTCCSKYGFVSSISRTSSLDQVADDAVWHDQGILQR